MHLRDYVTSPHLRTCVTNISERIHHTRRRSCIARIYQTSEMHRTKDLFALQVSSLVDEVFFVLKRSTHRAVRTSSLNAMGDVIMYVSTLLVTTYKEALEYLLASTDRYAF